MTLWIILALLCAAAAYTLWDFWWLVRREMDRRVAETALIESQIEDLKRKARHTRADGRWLH